MHHLDCIQIYLSPYYINGKHLQYFVISMYHLKLKLRLNTHKHKHKVIRYCGCIVITPYLSITINYCVVHVFVT